MKRLYDTLIKEHFAGFRQMFLLSGPRQVGKTTSAKTAIPNKYINWDNQEHRRKILSGYSEIINSNDISLMPKKETHIIFDEIHKYPKWKNYIKGFFDTYEKKFNIIITGSARLNIYKRGSDSLMGRYFTYRMHPLTTGELVKSKPPGEKLITNPKKINEEGFRQLIELGGFPEPYIKGEKRFYNRWRKLRSEQLFREDLRDLTSINEIDQLEILGQLLEKRTGQLINYSSLASDVQVSVNTVKNWISTLEQFYYCYRVKPWHTNVPKTLLKQPKIYFWDWSIVSDTGQRYENFVASHLLKAVHTWTDLGYGNFDLYFLRDKEKREVDFLISRDSRPWIIIEVKSADSGGLSPALNYYYSVVKPEHAFQVDFLSKYIDRNCFSIHTPVKVPAMTLLSQLI